MYINFNLIKYRLPISLLFLAGIVISCFAFFSIPVLAGDEWYGSGHRDPDWILERGGTIIKYKIKGEEKSNAYKVRMYFVNSVIEIEYGGKGYFDDAINNRYKIIVFKGTGKEIDTDVIAKPGQEVSITFDLDKGKSEQKAEQVIPLSEIRLTSKSSQYITPAELGRVSAVSRNEDDVVDEKIDQEDEKEGEVREGGNVEMEKESEEEDEDELSAEEELEEEITYAFEATFILLEKEIPEQIKMFEERSRFSWLLFGPDREALSELEVLIEEGEEALDEVDSLIEEMDEAEQNVVLVQKMEKAEEYLSQQVGILQEKKQEKKLWFRFGALFGW